MFRFGRNFGNDKESLIGILILAIFISFRMFPLQAAIISIVGLVGYALFITITNGTTFSRGKKTRRVEALRKAKVFLGYYSDIWKNLKLSNPHCYLNLGSDGKTIVGTEKNTESDFYRTFKVLKSNVHDIDEVWNMFCKNFTYNHTYEGLKEECRLYKLIIEETLVSNPKNNEKPDVAKVDINNATLDELTNLSGISVIMAKKAIKRREDIMGFKTVDEFLSYLNVQPKIAENLKPILYLTEIQGVKKKIEHYKERNIDL